MADYQQDGLQFMSDIGKDGLKMIVKENMNSVLEAIDKCSCPRSKCRIPESMHNILKQCLLLGQPEPQKESRTRAISFCNDGRLPNFDERCLVQEKRLKLATSPESHEYEDSGCFSGRQSLEEGCDVICGSNSCFDYHVRRGYLVLFNNIWFKDPKLTERDSGEEGKRIIKLFEKLGFTTKKHLNKTKSEMSDILKYMAVSNELEKYDCFVCICMSHGSENGFYGIEGIQYKLDDIIYQFTGENCKYAVGIPKIFMFQSCRGTKDDEGQKMAPRGPNDVVADCAGENNKTLNKIPTESDILVACSATHGMVAQRISENSVFVYELYKVLSQYADQEDIMTMLTRVNNAVSAPHNGTKYLDMSCVYSTLRKRVFLK